MKLNFIKETCLYISDIERSRIFYHDHLGLDIISIAKKRHIFFRVGPNILLCFIAEATKNENTLPPHYATGRQHIAFEVDFEDYVEWKVKLTHAKIEIIHEHEWSSSRSIYFHDPDKNVLEIVTPGLWD